MGRSLSISTPCLGLSHCHTSRSTSGGVACSVRATPANLAVAEWAEKGKESTQKETSIGDVLPWEDITDEAERLLAFGKGGRNAAKVGHDDKELENDQEVEGDGTDPYNEVIFGRRGPDSVVIDWANKVLYVLEFKRTSGKKSLFFHT